MILATFEMPSFTSRADATDMAKPHGLKLLYFKSRDGMKVAMFEAADDKQIAAFSADLSYGPTKVSST